MSQKSLIAFYLVWSLTCAFDVAAQAPADASEQSYQRARRTLEAGMQALGGLGAVASIKSLSLIERGKVSDVFQSPASHPPANHAETWQRLLVDFTAARLFYETGSRRPRYAWRSQTIINGGKGYRLDPWARTLWPVNTTSLSDFRSQFQKLPQFLLHEVLTERAASLRWLGASESEGRRYEVITFIDREQRQVALYFDTQTKLLSRYEYLLSDPAAGDTKAEFVYQGYRDIGKLKVPTGMSSRTGAYAASESSYEIQLNPVLAESEFALPDGYQMVAPAAPIPANRMTPIAKDVYLLENVENRYYNVLVVAFDDFLLVAEAPEARPHAGLSERVIAKIKETLPDKPIRYVTFSHHHVDHGCGLRAYLAEGATVITTPGNKQFVESLARAKFELKPDALARAPRLPVIETLENKRRVIRDAHHTVELYDIGPYWHAQEEVLVYLPQAKLLFDGDLSTSGFGEEVVPAYDHPLYLAEKIKELGLDVQQYAGVHGRLRPISDLYKAIEKRQRLDEQKQQAAPKTDNVVREYCANIGPVTLTFDGAMVAGRYRITVAPQPIEGTIRGTFEAGLLEATWTDSEGTGRIIFGFTADLSQFGAFFNSQKQPSHWFDGWKGVEAKQLDQVPVERRRSLRCEWK